jgi:hypothetical protein
MSEQPGFLTQAIQLIRDLSASERSLLFARLEHMELSRHQAMKRRDEILRSLPRWFEGLSERRTVQRICDEYARYQRTRWLTDRHSISPSKEIHGTIDEDLFELSKLANFPQAERVRQILRG